MFGFDERFAMFDITPLENQFILEYLPSAKGDYVKVFLYGLMRCYHPEQDMSLNRMCHELNMTEEEVFSAFSYWERKRLVRRISDKPPRWQYVNIKQLNMTGGDESLDPEYEEFCSAIYEAFDGVRRLHGSELSICFDWKESLKLPTEVIIMLMKHMIEKKGKNFRFPDADKTAAQMANEKILTVEAAEEFFSRDEKAYSGMRRILRLLGKNYAPSAAQVILYRKWTETWHFSHEAVEAAVELTAKGDPSTGYLDGILNSLRNEADDGTAVTPETIRQSSLKTESLKEIFKILGRGEINQRNLQLYEKMQALYSQEIILIAARECGHTGKDSDDLLKLLQSWKEKGLESEKDISEYVQVFHDQTALIRQLKKIWGTDDTRIGKADRSLVQKWENDFGFAPEAILAAAPCAAEAKQPMAYLDRILADYSGTGITAPDQIRLEFEKRRNSKKNTGKTVPGQDFIQRDYRDVPDEMERDLAQEIRAFMKEDGGQSDA